MRTRPRASTCESARRRAADAYALDIGFASARRKNDRLSIDTVRSTFFSLTPGGTFSEPGEKFRIARTPAWTAALTTPCADSAGTATTAMSMRSRFTSFRNSPMSKMRTPPRDRRPILRPLGVEERDDGEAFLPESRIVGEREPEVAGAEDRDAHRPIESEDRPQVPLQLLDVVADAADAELAEVRQVLPNLGGVELELLGQRLRGDRLDAGRVERVQAAKVDRQPPGGELGDLVARRPGLVPRVTSGGF